MNDPLLLVSLLSLGVCTATFAYLRSRLRPKAAEHQAQAVFDTALRNSKIGIFFSILFVIIALL